VTETSPRDLLANDWMERPSGLSEDEPGFIVFDITVVMPPPTFQGRTTGVSKRVHLPILAVRDYSGEVAVPNEGLSWSSHLLGHGVLNRDVRRRLRSIGRLFEFSERTMDGGLGKPGAVDLLVWGYLRARLETPLDPALRSYEHWHSVTYETVRTEFRDIVEFARFCADYSGRTSPIGNAFKAGADVWRKAVTALAPDDFLSHLDAQRSRWHALLGEDIPAPPTSLKNLAVNLGSEKAANETSLSIEEVDAIINREQNSTFRAVWLALAYLGPRISELLNLWRCDVLDATYARRLFNSEVSGPLVIFADPRRSRYVGQFDDGRSISTRKDVLAKKFGLQPRPDLTGKRQRAGWKGMSVFNPDLRITHGTWASAERAAQFADLVSEIFEVHQTVRTDGLHPYLFVNGKNAEYLGEPLSIGNVEKAFERACLRAGIVPYSPGAHLHGLRHFYRWYAKNALKLPDELIQLMLRQRNVRSQRVYGKKASDLHDAISQFYDRGRS
jgi:integrase